MSAEHKKILTVGGGSGLPTINEALHHTNQFPHMDSIGAVFDSGGATGRRRIDAYGREVAHGDTLRVLGSLVHPDNRDAKYDVMQKWLKHRDTRDRVLGQDMLERFSSPDTGYEEIQKDWETLGINFTGRLLPASTEPSHIVFTTGSGRQFNGEHNFDEERMSKDPVMNMVLSPEVQAFGPTADALSQAELIVLSSGDLLPSVLANFLPGGMKEALAKSTAPMFLVTNLVSTRNVTHQFQPEDFVSIVEQYTGRRPDGLIVPEMSRGAFESRHPRVSSLYDLEHSHFLGWEDEALHDFQANEGVRIVTHQATDVVMKGPRGIVRHNPEKLANALREILPTK